jgi:hypothetical protein
MVVLYGRTVEFTVEKRLACAPETAFDTMADVRNETEWNSQVSRAELRSEEPIGAGSRFLTVNRGKEYDATIATYDRARRLVFDVAGAPMDITATFDFAPDGDGTRLAGRFDMRPKGAFKVVFPLMAPLVRKDLAAQSERFRALCERRA